MPQLPSDKPLIEPARQRPAGTRGPMRFPGDQPKPPSGPPLRLPDAWTRTDKVGPAQHP